MTLKNKLLLPEGTIIQAGDWGILACRNRTCWWQVQQDSVTDGSRVRKSCLYLREWAGRDAHTAVAEALKTRMPVLIRSELPTMKTKENPTTIDLRTDHISLWQSGLKIRDAYNRTYLGRDLKTLLEGKFGVRPAYIAPSGGKQGYVLLYKRQDVERVCAALVATNQLKQAKTLNPPPAVKTECSTPRPVMNMQEAADYLRVSLRTLGTLVSKRRIRAARIGRRLVIKREELDRFVNLQTAINS
jgi:excisionase family DNA binding protein